MPRIAAESANSFRPSALMMPFFFPETPGLVQERVLDLLPVKTTRERHILEPSGDLRHGFLEQLFEVQFGDLDQLQWLKF